MERVYFNAWAKFLKLFLGVRRREWHWGRDGDVAGRGVPDGDREEG